MKKVFWYAGSFVAVAGMVSLVACGGLSSFDLGGTVTGLNQPGLILVNHGSTLNIKENVSSYSFPNKLSYGTAYDVAVQTQIDPVTKLPVAIQPRHLACSVINGSGTAGINVSTAVNVFCTTATHSITGPVNGLTKATDGLLALTVTTGGIAAPTSTVTMVNGVNFIFSGIPDGSTYSITVAAATGNTCKVLNGTGIMGESDITTGVEVNCTEP